MTVELKPETERLVQEEIRSGHIHSVDELILFGVQALRQKRGTDPLEFGQRRTLHDLLTNPPFAGSELTIDRPSNLI